MSSMRVTPLHRNIWGLLGIPLTSSAKLRILSMTEGISSHQFVSSFHTCIPSKPISHFLCNSILFRNSTLRTLPPFGQNPNVFQLRWLSSSSNQQSFTSSYLINSVGLSPETALSVSKLVNIKTCEKPDKVLNLFKKYGFSQTQISSLVRIIPRLLYLDAEKNILPKLEFFQTKGISGPEMAKILSVFPRIMTASLVNQIIPSYDFFRSLFQSDEKVIAAIKRFPDLLKHNIEKHVSPRIDILREHGVPDPNVARLILYQPRVFIISLDRFRETVEKVVEIGFDGLKVTFVLAVRALLSMSESTWESKVDAYKKWGWSDEDVLRAFRRTPLCMMVSEEKIMAGMDFFINKMGWSPCLIAGSPVILTYSLKKRVVPRCSVFRVLLSKSSVEKEVNLNSLLTASEKKFLQRFVASYKKDAPELLKMYKAELDRANGPHIHNELC